MTPLETAQEQRLNILRTTLARERIVFTDIIAEMNQRLIDRTDGFMFRLSHKTLRERYVPETQYNELRTLCIDVIKNFATEATDDQHAQTLESISAHMLGTT